MKRQTLTIMTIVLILFSCRPDATQTDSQTVKSFDYKDKHLSVTRTITQIQKDVYKISIKITSAEQLEGYVTVEDKFENPIQNTDSVKWNYNPYFTSNKEIRFVFSDSDKTDGPALPIPNVKNFQVDYTVKVDDNKKLRIGGTIMYLEKYGKHLVPVPELKTSADF